MARSLGPVGEVGRGGGGACGITWGARQPLLVLDGVSTGRRARGHGGRAAAGCPGLRIIATSLHVLGVAGEVTIAVPPMTVPAEDDPNGPEELLGYEAVRLFADRAAAVLPGFAVDGAMARRWPGCAGRWTGSRSRSSWPRCGCGRCRRGRSWTGWTRGSSCCPAAVLAGQPHHRTLQAALEWSYELLTDGEQAMWRRVSVFAGSFDLDAAEAVCAVGRVAAGQIADLIDALVAKSILLREGQGTARYRLLDTIREFGLAKLRGRGNERALRRRHRAYYAALAARQEAFGPGRAEWIAALDADHETCGSPCGSAWPIRRRRPRARRSPVTCGGTGKPAATSPRDAASWRRCSTSSTGLSGPARVLWTAGFLAQFQGDIPAARRLLEACLSAARPAGDVSAEAWASSFLGWVVYYDGDADQGHALARTALQLHREAGDHLGVVLALTQIGYIHMCAGEAKPAACWFTRCAAACQDSGNVWYHAYAQWGLAVVALLRGDHAGAARQGCAALRAIRCMDDAMGVVLCLDALAWAAAAGHETVRAATLAAAAEGGGREATLIDERSRRRATSARDPCRGRAWRAAVVMRRRMIRSVALASTRCLIAASRHETARSPPARRPRGLGGHPGHVAVPLPAHHDAALQVARAALPGAEYRAAFAKGSAMDPAEAIAFALGEPARPRPDAGQAGPGQLTRREREVAALVARGQSNGQIAASLVISVRTVETHVQHIMDKLGCSTRAQIAAWLAARSPVALTAGPRYLAWRWGDGC